MSKTTVRMVAALLTAALAAAGCSSSGGGGGTTSSVPAPPTSSQPAASQPPVSAPQTTPGGPATITQATAQAALLTTSDVGSGFRKAQFRPSHDPLPCAPNDPPLEQQLPSNSEVGTAFIRNGAAFGEDIRVYGDASTAGNVVARAAGGLNCPSGKLNLTGKPTTVEFTKVQGSRIQNVTSAVGADLAFAVQGSTSQYDIVLIGCQVGNAAVLFSFLRTQSTPTSTLPNPIAIVATAIQKLRNS